jgi:hypothetical protein
MKIVNVDGVDIGLEHNFPGPEEELMSDVPSHGNNVQVSESEGARVPIPGLASWGHNPPTLKDIKRGLISDMPTNIQSRYPSSH